MDNKRFLDSRLDMVVKFKETIPPRAFDVGESRSIEIFDCAQVELAPNEQITLKTESGAEYDIVRKSWGYYATPSLNGRLKFFGLKTALVKNSSSKFYVVLVENGKVEEFQKYLKIEELTIICWLDNDECLGNLEVS